MTEELKAIAEMIANLGEAGMTAFVIYVVVDGLKSAMWATVAGVALYTILKRIGQAVANVVKAHVDAS